MIEQKFDTEQNILFVVNTGRLEFESMKTYFLSLKKYTSSTSNLFILEDARNINVRFSSEHLFRLSQLLDKVAQEYNNVYHAVVLEESKNIAYAIMINEGISEANYSLKVFSDFDMAKDWVKNELV